MPENNENEKSLSEKIAQAKSDIEQDKPEKPENAPPDRAKRRPPPPYARRTPPPYAKKRPTVGPDGKPIKRRPPPPGARRPKKRPLTPAEKKAREKAMLREQKLKEKEQRLKEKEQKRAVKAEQKLKKREGKKGFTKKQVLTIVGLILALLLVIVLVIYIIFSGYWDKMIHGQKRYNNSEAMNYSDVDRTRSDTLDKAKEDAKLKELMKNGKKISNKDVMNILLIGEDLRDTESGNAGNTDVMMILSVNTKDKTITMTSVMRDCYVNFQDDNGYWYSTRINAAYWHGGVALTQKTIEELLGVKIDRYVLVNFKVFIDIVDTLGGLDLKVTDEEANGEPGADPNGDNTRGMQNPLDEQNKYLGNKKGTDYIAKGGNLHLNGNQALAYARLRHVGNSDYDRTKRQRRIIAEMIKKSRKLSLVDMDKLAKRVLPQVTSDITKKETAQLLVDMLDYRNYKIQDFRIPADDTFTNQIIDGMDVLSVDFPTNAQMFKEKVYGSIKLDEEGNESKPKIE